MLVIAVDSVCCWYFRTIWHLSMLLLIAEMSRWQNCCWIWNV